MRSEPRIALMRALSPILTASRANSHWVTKRRARHLGAKVHATCGQNDSLQRRRRFLARLSGIAVKH